ncbi:MAG: ABC transporter permease [Gemmatimonadetes bacterium]|nr:ABC transporter permease [Gemmatimonadota bacterium]
MVGYVLRRIAFIVPTLIGVSLIAFFLVHWMPGDPAEILAGEHASPEVIEQFRKDLRLDRPLPEQYLLYVGGLVRGDLGRSAKTHEPVSAEIRRYFPATVELALTALFIATLLGTAMGALAARRPGGWADAASTSAAALGVSMPVFWLGLLLMYLLAVRFPVLPVSGRSPALLEIEVRTGFLLLDTVWTGNREGFVAALRHLALPAVVLATVPLAVIARITRSSLLEAMGRDYIRTARAKGVAEAVVLLRHAARNSILPTLTVIGLQFGFLLGGAIITETIFAWPGIGRWIVLAVEARDPRVLQAGVLLMAVSFTLVNLVTDVAYAALDPRIKLR